MAEASITAYHEKLSHIRMAVGQVLVGQEQLVDRLLMALLCEGHVLLEGVPGVGKTLCVNTLANVVDAAFSRVQFTPDLLPGDLTGTVIYNPRDHTFTSEKGPVFTNLLLADEINRSPAKVQSALLEAMQEKQVTLGKETYALPQPFMVLATQNPVEQEGTYLLPEAQTDRFMFKLLVGYPSLDEEMVIMTRMGNTKVMHEVAPVATLEDLENLGRVINDIYLDEKIKRYILSLVDATRHPEKYKLELKAYIRFGASPRASIYLMLAAKAQALFSSRNYVVPEDVKSIACDVLRHRLALSYRAEADGLQADDLLKQILAGVPVTEAVV